jgi:hypothetical protein
VTMAALWPQISWRRSWRETTRRWLPGRSGRRGHRRGIDVPRHVRLLRTRGGGRHGRAPQGRRDRLVRFESPGTRGVVAWCLKPHDLWISKMVAGRPKDLEFCQALMKRGMVEPEELARRLERLDADERVNARIAGKIRAWYPTAPQ